MFQVPILFLGILLLTSSTLNAIIDSNNNGVSDLWERHYNSGNLYTTFNSAAAQDGFEFKRKTATGFESFTPGEILEGSALYNEITGQRGLVLFARLSPAIDQLHRLSLDLLPNSDTLEPLEIGKLELMPVIIHDNTPATGVDNVSITAGPSDIGYQSKFWIMAPCGNDPAGNRCSDDTTLKIPTEPANKLRMNCSLADCEYRDPEGSNPSFPAIPIGKGITSTVRWLGTGAESGDHTPLFLLGDIRKQVELPIRVKTMKRRTVKVAVWPVNRPAMDPIFPDPASRSAYAAALQTRLNKVFAYQVNAWFDVAVKPNVSFNHVDGPAPPDYSQPYTISHGAKEKEMIDAHREGGVDINVYLIDVAYWTGKPNDLADPLAHKIAGSSYPSNEVDSGTYKNCAVVNMNLFYTASADNLHTASHEIGHLLLGGGHPNEYLATMPRIGGPAPLQHLTLADHKKRLMCSGNVAESGSRLLVKTEWDEAEKWLTKFPDKRIFDSTGQTGNY